MWTLVLIYAMRGLLTPEWQPSASAPDQTPAMAEARVEDVASQPAEAAEPSAPPAELTLDEIADLEPLVRHYLQQERAAEEELAELEKKFGRNHRRVMEATSRRKIFRLRAEEFAAKYRDNPKVVAAHHHPDIRKALDVIDEIDVEINMLRPRAGPNHPLLQNLQRYRDEYDRKIRDLLSGGAV